MAPVAADQEPSPSKKTLKRKREPTYTMPWPMQGTDEPLDLVRGVGRLFDNAQFSDVTIRLGEVELRAHGIVLAANSEYFARALSCDSEGSKMSVFDFKDGSMHAYARCFRFIYTGDYDEKPMKKIPAPDDHELLVHVRVYQLAEYFGIRQLRERALKRFKDKLRDRGTDKEGYIECIRDLYAQPMDTDRQCELRQALVRATKANVDYLWCEPLKDLVQKGGEFAIDMIDPSKATPWDSARWGSW